EISCRLLFGSGDRVAHGLFLNIAGDMDERRFRRLLIGIRAAVESAVMRGTFPQPQAPLAPDDAGQLLDEVLFGRPPWLVLGDECFYQRPIFLAVLPRQNGVLRQQPVPKRIKAGEFVIAATRLQKRLDVLRKGHMSQNSFARSSPDGANVGPAFKPFPSLQDDTELFPSPASSL